MKVLFPKLSEKKLLVILGLMFPCRNLVTSVNDYYDDPPSATKSTSRGSDSELAL